MPYEVRIDDDLCAGSSTCTAEAPKTFALGPEGIAVVLDGPHDDDAVILHAARICPNGAIVLRDLETGEELRV